MSSSDPASGEKISFSLSESAFALFPPLEQHDSAFPALAQPMLETSPLMHSSPLGVRGDRYADDRSAMGGNPEARFAQLMVSAAQSHPPPPHTSTPPLLPPSAWTQWRQVESGPGAGTRRGPPGAARR